MNDSLTADTQDFLTYIWEAATPVPVGATIPAGTPCIYRSAVKRGLYSITMEGLTKPLIVESEEYRSLTASSILPDWVNEDDAVRATCPLCKTTATFTIERDPAYSGLWCITGNHWADWHELDNVQRLIAAPIHAPAAGPTIPTPEAEMAALTEVLETKNLLAPIRKDLVLLRTIAHFVDPKLRTAKIALWKISSRAGYSSSHISKEIRRHTDAGLKLRAGRHDQKPITVNLPPLEAIIDYISHHIPRQNPETLAPALLAATERAMKGNS